MIDQVFSQKRILDVSEETSFLSFVLRNHWGLQARHSFYLRLGTSDIIDSEDDDDDDEEELDDEDDDEEEDDDDTDDEDTEEEEADSVLIAAE